MKFYTIGHSTHSQDEFIELLKHFDIKTVLDVRSLPGSTYMPAYNKESMEKWLPESGINYKHMLNLGGLRKKNKTIDPKLVEGWRNASFKNYAAYSLSNAYQKGVKELELKGKEHSVVIMCSEALPWRCHRLIISNSLVKDTHRVEHIIAKNNTIEHVLGLYGAKPVVVDDKIIYPKEEGG